MTPSAELLIVTEKVDDVRLIRTILHDDLTGNLRFYAGQGDISLASLARNLLVHEGGRVLIVADSNTLSPLLRQERESLALAAMGGVSPPGLFDIFTFVPELEVVFFESPAVLEQVLGQEISPQTIEEGQLAPKKILTRILKNAEIADLEALIRKLKEPAIQILAQGRQAKAMKEKVRRMCHSATVLEK